MEISIQEAAGRLVELIDRAEAGEAVIVTREGRPAVQIATVKPKLTPEEKRRRFEAIEAVLAAKVDTSGPSAARSQDYLYDEDGMPK